MGASERSVKDIWYGDRRDLVKWATLAHLAERHSLMTIVQVPYLRFGARGTLQFDDGQVPILSEVWSFFRDITAVRSLGDILRRQIVVIDEPFVPGRRPAYRHRVVEAVKALESPKIVLLDPDTGLAPAKPTSKHATREDVAAVWEVLQPGDWLAVYQHRSHNKTWKQDAAKRFASMCGDNVELYDAPDIASDVLFLAKRKP